MRILVRLHPPALGVFVVFILAASVGVQRFHTVAFIGEKEPTLSWCIGLLCVWILFLLSFFFLSFSLDTLPWSSIHVVG